MVKETTAFGPTRGFLLILSFGMIAWAGIVLNPAVSTFGASSIYSHMAGIASENVWGVFFLSSGLVMLWGTIKRSVDVMGLGTILGSILWLMLATSYALTSLALTPIVTTGTMALLHAWGWWSVKRNPGTIQNKHIWTDEEVQLMADLLEVQGKKRK